MKTEETDLPPVERTSTPCAACGGSNQKGWVVWDQPMCGSCKNAWDQEAPSDAQWDAWHPEDKARYAAKKTWTAKWASKRKSQGRAA